MSNKIKAIVSGHTPSQENKPQYVITGQYTPLTIKHILTERPLLNNRKRQFFGSTNKTMKLQDTVTLYKSVTNIDPLTKL